MRTDRDIQYRIEQELLWDPTVDGKSIQVSVHQHVATLRGCVPSCPQKLAAQCAAQRILGDDSLVMELVVRPPEPTVTDDDELANAVSSALDWQGELPRHAVRAVVEHGCVTLDGEVSCGSQREAAEAIVSRMRGVVSVSNRITVSDHPLRNEVYARIAASLPRLGEPAATTVRVEDRDGVVRLTGTVGTIAEKEQASKVAWMTHGVKWVIDQLDVM